MFSASLGQLTERQRKMLPVGCRSEVVVGVSKVCQVSQLYTAIDDLATRELGSMPPSLFTLQVSLVFSHGHVLQSCFFFFPEPRW